MYSEKYYGSHERMYPRYRVQERLDHRNPHGRRTYNFGPFQLDEHEIEFLEKVAKFILVLLLIYIIYKWIMNENYQHPQHYQYQLPMCGGDPEWKGTRVQRFSPLYPMRVLNGYGARNPDYFYPRHTMPDGM